MIIDRFGISHAPSKIKAITQLSQPSTADEVRVLIGMVGYLWKFVPNFSLVLAPISDLLRDSPFCTKKARRLKAPWSQDQTEAIKTLVSLLTSPPTLALPDLNRPVRLHTDASETGAGAVLTQIQQMVENPYKSICKPPMVKEWRKEATDR